MQEFHVGTRREGDWLVMSVMGDLDVYTATRLKEAIIGEAQSGRVFIALDLSGVEFLDSTGLAAMIGGMKRLRERGGTLVLVTPNPQIRRILEITDLSKILPWYDTMEEAVRRLPELTG